MEKIQSALAKARAERLGRKPLAEQEAQRPLVRRTESEEAWNALLPLELSAPQMERNRIVALREGREAIGVDMMRTRVLQQMQANNWRRLAITSPTASCGKSTIALNLAFSLSRQADLRTILLELDLRKPSIAKTLGIKERHNFAKVMDGSEKFADHAMRYEKNLAIATNQNPARRPAELLQGSKATRAIAQIEETYAPDIMIMDMPPMLVSDDTIAFMDKVDCVLLIAAAETTTIKEIDYCERELSEHTNMMGVILNKCRYMGPDYGYGYYN